MIASQGVLAPTDPKGIILVNPIGMMSQGDTCPNYDPLNAMEDGVEERMDVDGNVDMFLNFENIDKRKRIEEGEGCSSHA